MLIRFVMSIVTLVSSSSNANFSGENEANNDNEIPATTGIERFSKQSALELALLKGAVVILPGTKPVISNEVHQMLIQLNRAQEFFKKPVLVFDGNKIRIENEELLELSFTSPGQTIGSF